MGPILGWGAKIPHAWWPKKPKHKTEAKCNKFNKDFKNGPHQKKKKSGFPGGSVVENLPANAGDTGSSPGLGRSHVLRSY